VYIVYSILLFLGLLIKFPSYFFKVKIQRKEGFSLRERLGAGLTQGRPRQPSLWIHAVSVGEVLSLQNLTRRLKAQHPDWQVHFSSLTASGLKVAAEKLQGVDHLFFIPLDFAGVVRKFFKALNPRLLVLAESEFWPNLLRVARQSGCSVLLINGRISERSFRRMKRLMPVVRRILNNLDFSLVQTKQDRDRLEALGIPSARIKVSGNLKSEASLWPLSAAEVAALKGSLGIAEGKKVVVAGSTRRGEEELLLEAFLRARRTRFDIRLIIAPRHAERFAEVDKLSQNLGLVTKRRTALKPGEGWEVLILDTIGELAQFYALSDAAFVGGSLIPWGGQNLLEPAFYGKPVFFGPHMKNFAALAEAFVSSGGARIVSKPEELEEMFLFADSLALEAQGRKAREILQSLQGATNQTLAAIEQFMITKQI
jgi:3-deoxy-D-manno-octulosonic-acid transferase